MRSRTQTVLRPIDGKDLREAQRVVDRLAIVSRRIEAAVVTPWGEVAIQIRDSRFANNPIEVAGVARRGQLVTLDIARLRALYASELTGDTSR